MILSLLVVSVIVSSYKPLVSSVQQNVCAYSPQYTRINFILDVIYGILITAVPFTLISIFNSLIVRRLVLTRRRHRRARFKFEETIVKLEFTFILLLISSCFIVLNLPYFVVWCERMITVASAYSDGNSKTDLSLTNLFTLSTDKSTDSSSDHTNRMRAVLYITKTIFCCNYCVNFFLYSLTGVHFRRQLRFLCSFRRGGPHQNVLHFSKTLVSDVSKLGLHNTHVEHRINVSPKISPSSSML